MSCESLFWVTGVALVEALIIALIWRKNRMREVVIEQFCDEVRDLHEELVEQSHRANYDALTGVYSRQGGLAAFAHALQVCAREKKDGAVFFLDLDGFKWVNDTLGHYAGDRLLVEVAERLRSSCRKSDILMRLGGDEFVLVLVGADRGMVEVFANRLLRRLSEPYTALPEAAIGASVGVRCFTSGEIDEKELIAAADVAMYEAKGGGKNKIVFAT